MESVGVVTVVSHRGWRVAASLAGSICIGLLAGAMAPGAVAGAPANGPVVPGWSLRSEGGGTLRDVAVDEVQSGWAVGDGGRVVRLVPGSVVDALSPVTADLNAVVIVPGGDAWAVGDRGTLMRTVNGAWRRQSSGTDADLYDVAVGPHGDVWAVGGRAGSADQLAYGAVVLCRAGEGCDVDYDFGGGVLHGVNVGEIGDFAVYAVGGSPVGWGRTFGASMLLTLQEEEVAPGLVMSQWHLTELYGPGRFPWYAVTSVGARSWIVGAYGGGPNVVEMIGYHEVRGWVAGESDLRSVSAAADEVWATGDAGVLVNVRNSWMRVYNDSRRAALYGVHLVKVNDGWAVGERGVILRYLGDRSRLVLPVGLSGYVRG